MDYPIKLPIIEKEILKRFRIYLVGGTVRDHLLGREINDYDLVVFEDLSEFLKFLKKQYPAVTIFPLSEEDQEFRCVISDRLWLDISAPKGSSIEEDLFRRDFTLNAIAIDLTYNKVIDPLNGKRDIEQGIIRMVSAGNLIDDPLRMLRAYRFKSILGFEIEMKTRNYIKELSCILSYKRIAAERIRYELELILSNKNGGEILKLMAEDDILFSIFPELVPMKFTSQRYYQNQNLMFHILMAVSNLENILEERGYERDIKWLLKLAMLLHDVAKPDTLFYDEEGNTHFYGHDMLGAEKVEQIAERLKLSKREKNILKKLVRYHMYPHLLAAQNVLTDKALNRYLRRLEELAFPMLDMAIADAMASPPRGEGILPYNTFRERLIKLIEEKQKFSKDRLITGDDLIELGLQPGPIFKVILGEIDDLIAEGKIRSREDAIKFVKQNYLQG